MKKSPHYNNFFNKVNKDDINKLLGINPLSKVQKTYLMYVYLFLALGVFVCGASVLLTSFLSLLIPRILLTVITFVSFVLGCGYFRNVFVERSQNLRRDILIFIVTAASIGAMINSFVMEVYYFAPDILFSALLSSSLAFIGLTLCAAVSTTRYNMLLYIGVVQLSMYLSLIYIGNFFFNNTGLNNIINIGSIFVTSIYTWLQSQAIIERAERGAFIPVNDAFALLSNLVELFIRVLYVLLNHESYKRKRNRHRNDD